MHDSRCRHEREPSHGETRRGRAGVGRSGIGSGRVDSKLAGVSRQPLRLAIQEAERTLAMAGVSSPRVDAESLAAYLLGVERTKLMMVPLVDPSLVRELRELVGQRAERVPLQHLTGTATLGPVTVRVGPGVFVPRPETELLLSWGLSVVEQLVRPTIVDLCTGSGALALALARSRPDARVYGVENDSTALSWARWNADERAAAGDSPITLYAGDVADPDALSSLDGAVDVVVCNPPYVPQGTPVSPEVREHDPAAAVFGGRDGLDVVRHVVSFAGKLLRSGGGLAIEHDDAHGGSVPALLSARHAFDDVADHTDLAGRPRFATARRVACD